MGDGQGGVDWGRLFSVAWRWKFALLAIVVLIPAGVYLLSKTLPKTYEASTTIQIEGTSLSSAQIAGLGVTFTVSGVQEASRLIQTTPVARVAAKRIGEPPSAAPGLLGSIRVRADQTEQSGFLTITASDHDPGRAARIANAFAYAIGATRTADAINKIDATISELQRTPVRTADDRAQVSDQLKQLQTLRASQTDSSSVIEPAAAPSTPVSPHPARNAALGLVAALLIAGGLVVVLTKADRRLRKPEELARVAGAPLLGMIPATAFEEAAPDPYVNEAFQTLRTGLTYFNVDRDLKSVMITSPLRADGKTTVATDLAIALAQGGNDVVLIDADMRRPQVAKRLGIADQVHFGLDAVLVQHRALDDALLELKLEGGRLRVLPGGSPPPNPSVLLASRRMQSTLKTLAGQADLVIVDTPALLSVSDAIPLVEQVSGIVLVGRVEHTSEDSLIRARDVIATAKGEVLGAVATGTQAGGLYSYKYGYDYVDDVDAESPNGNGRPAESQPWEVVPASRPRATKARRRKPATARKSG